MGDPTDAPGRTDGDPAEDTSPVVSASGAPLGGLEDGAGEPDPDVERFTQRWLHALDRSGCLVVPAAEAADPLRALGARLAAAVRGPQLDLERASAVGRALTDDRFDPARVLQPTIATVVEGFAADLGDTIPIAHRPAVADLAGALAQGFAQASRERAAAAHEDRLATRHRLEGIFAQAAVGIGIVDPDGRVLDVNPSMAAMIGMPAEQLRGRTLRQVVGVSTAEVTKHYRDLVSGRIEHFRLELGGSPRRSPCPKAR